MTGPHEVRRKRIRYRANHRGMQETDRLLGGFAEDCLDRLDADQLGRFEILLDESDQDLLAWISGADTVPAAFDNDIMSLLIEFKKRL